MRRFLTVLGGALALLAGTTPAAHAAVPAGQAANLAAAERMLDVMARATDSFAEAVELALVASEHQIAALGGTPRAASTPAHALPSQAVAELASRYGVSADATVLDALPANLRDALTRVIDAFLAVDATAHEVYVAGKPPALPDLALMLDVRGPLLRAIASVEYILEHWVGPVPPPPSQLSFCPAFSIDLGTENDTYTADCALVIDAGGDDIYANNAGGGAFDLADPTSPVAAALADLGAGADRYGTSSPSRDGGVNGGGALGSGLLVDGGGDDSYVVDKWWGVNGGGYLGTGLVVDAGGADTRDGGSSSAANGGGWQGAGLLVDTGGQPDSYVGMVLGVNGGGADGAGLLVDDGGDDTYTAVGNGANGGGSLGHGFLLDGGGGDGYVAAGSSFYCAGASGSCGTNGGGLLGVGFLYDAGNGTDSYVAGGNGANGAAGPLGAAGLLLDAGGLGDTYSDTELTCNGSGTDRLVVPKCPLGAQLDLI